jgi:hypothetical protein
MMMMMMMMTSIVELSLGAYVCADLQESMLLFPQ